MVPKGNKPDCEMSHSPAFIFGGAEMTRYERLIAKIAEETEKAEKSKILGDAEMEMFHRNAAKGFQWQLRALHVDEAAELV